MKRFENQEEMSANDSEVQLEVLMSSEKEPQSILRKRKTGNILC